LGDPEELARWAAQAAQPEPAPKTGSPPWSRLSLADGLPSVALLHAVLGAQRPESVAAARAFLRATLATREITERQGLYYGIPAVAFCLRILLVGRQSEDSERLQALLDERTAEIADETRAHHDVINGLTGLGRVLLDAGEGHRPTVRKILVELVALLREVPAGADLGLAHGIAGPLALLATAIRRDVVVPGQYEAVRATARWLDERVRLDLDGPYWPLLDGSVVQAAAPAWAAWCRGPLGTAVGLRAAALALDEPDWLYLAHAAMTATARRSLRAPRTSEAEPGLCHGAAGALAVTALVARHDHHLELAGLADRFAQRVLDEVSAAPQAEFVTATRPGLLVGAAGVALALHTWRSLRSDADDGVAGAGAGVHPTAWAAAMLVG
jgi:hypothetical protein